MENKRLFEILNRTFFLYLL